MDKHEHEAWSRNKTFMQAIRHAMHGVAAVVRGEPNIRRQIIIAVGAILVASMLQVSFERMVILLLIIAVVLSTEMMNSALEKLADACLPQYNEAIRLAKDIAAGAVLIVSVAAVLGGIIIFLSQLLT